MVFLGAFDAESQTSYSIKKQGNGLYVFIIFGDIVVENQELNEKDALGIVDFNTITISVKSNAKILLMEIPMTI